VSLLICVGYFVGFDFMRVRKIAKSDFWLRHVCPYARPPISMEQLGSHWTDFHEILYLIFFQKSIKEIQVSFKSENNNGYYT
jgi:hypothetical protein